MALNKQIKEVVTDCVKVGCKGLQGIIDGVFFIPSGIRYYKENIDAIDKATIDHAGGKGKLPTAREMAEFITYSWVGAYTALWGLLPGIGLLYHSNPSGGKSALASITATNLVSGFYELMRHRKKVAERYHTIDVETRAV